MDAFNTRPGTVDAFCDTHDVSMSSIGYWRQKLAATGTNTRHRSPRNKIVPVRFEAPTLWRDPLGVLDAR